MTPDGNTPLDEDEAADLIPLLTTQGELNEYEARNIVRGVIWAQSSRIIHASLLTESTLKRLHREMFGETWKWAGKFRQTDKNIGCESWQVPDHIRNLLADVQAWMEHETYPPREIAARFHHRLVWIHPFPNGNGRFARLATDLLCRQQGWPRSKWGANILASESAPRDAYIHALQRADAHDFAPLIQFMYND